MHFGKAEYISSDYLYLIRLLVSIKGKWVRQLSKWYVIELRIINYGISDRGSSKKLENKKSQKNIYEGLHSVFFSEREQNGQIAGNLVFTRNL